METRIVIFMQRGGIRMSQTDMTIQERKKEIDQINKKLAVIGSRELLIVHTTITALYNRQQLDEYEQSLNQPIREPELTGKTGR